MQYMLGLYHTLFLFYLVIFKHTHENLVMIERRLQEEYNDGDKVERFGCDHRYHMDCVNQWLSLKNWCPICKVSTTPPPPPS
ncbi:hypothetical protein RND81_03G176300 [Saponaria officinalis]|uniref:RING-type E3 ubiquitin transferase n=1 Tax=Saponaria officinalis TaxID=3572 RepID=A0AAW1MA79_SAPOF